MDSADLENRFAYHPPATAAKREAHASVRAECRRLADFLNERLPEGREKSLAVTHLEETMMWANAALARSAD